MTLLRFFKDALGHMLRGPLAYWLWIGLLACGVMLGGWHYYAQIKNGLTVTNMSDQVAWGFYIANFTFLVGVAAAAAMMVIPVYIYRNDALHDLVIFGELFAVAAIMMCMGFVMVDLGRPDRAMHLMRLNFPDSMLAWDVAATATIMASITILFIIPFPPSFCPEWVRVITRDQNQKKMPTAFASEKSEDC